MSPPNDRVLDAIAQSVRHAGRYNRDDKTQPAAVLWPDPDRCWEPVMDLLRRVLPVLTLGSFDESMQTGPAIWIRLQLADLSKEAVAETPVVYLPGVERHDLRAIETSPAALQPLAELQFRAAWWLRGNQTPWTPSGFLRGTEGLGLDLARSEPTTKALSASLREVVALPLESLRARGRIDSNYLSSLLVSDVARMLLRWIDSPEDTRSSAKANEWAAFTSQCRSEFGADIEKEGVLTITQRFAERADSWDLVWQRYTENAHAYPHIVDRLRQAKPPAATLFEEGPARYPQDNEEAEHRLKGALAALDSGTPAAARAAIAAMEDEHGGRRSEVWSTLGLSPLADALEPLAEVAAKTATSPSQPAIDSFVAWYVNEGFKVDESALRALAKVTDPSLREAVGTAVRAVYLPWADDAARHFQDILAKADRRGDVGLTLRDGDCVVFVDGLRYDVGDQLRARLTEKGVEVLMASRLAAVPTMTSTGKPAVAPLLEKPHGGPELTPVVQSGAATAPNLRKQLETEGVQAITVGRMGNPVGRGWTEAADLDGTGHKLGLKLVDRIPQEVADVATGIQQLLDDGWQRVHVVTDHGWLLMPGGLPKVELPEHLTVVRKSRCARLHDGVAKVDQPTYPWTWDESVRIAVPRGVAAFETGCIYEHGGVSPQESITPHLVVSARKRAGGTRIDGVKWINLRCRVDYSWAPPGAVIEIRRSPGDGSTSVAPSKPVEGSNEVSVLVDDDALAGQAAYVVILSATDEILAQLPTMVGS